MCKKGTGLSASLQIIPITFIVKKVQDLPYLSFTRHGGMVHVISLGPFLYALIITKLYGSHNWIMRFRSVSQRGYGHFHEVFSLQIRYKAICAYIQWQLGHFSNPKNNIQTMCVYPKTKFCQHWHQNWMFFGLTKYNVHNGFKVYLYLGYELSFLWAELLEKKEGKKKKKILESHKQNTKDQVWSNSGLDLKHYQVQYCHT